MAGGGENIMVILSSPSGVGKTTLTKKIQQKYHNFKISVSHTTRSPRSNEIDGIDYHFVSKEKFQEILNLHNYGLIQTEIKIIKTFYYAEEYHQKYLYKNPNGYCGLKGLEVSYS